MQMVALPVKDQLRTWGPSAAVSVSSDEAVAYCRALARTHGENFPVLSTLVPARLRDDFAVVYSFCRWADDLADELGDVDEATSMLAWWRSELALSYEGKANHPVLVALQATAKRHALPQELFAQLIDAFEQDQTVDRYDTWSQLMEYCARSANPVGRLVLLMLESNPTESMFRLSDDICTGLQLANHWQDIGRDILERDRVYIPRELIDAPNFDQRLRTSAAQGWACDATFLSESTAIVQQCVTRTWPLFEHGRGLIDELAPTSRPVVRLFAEGGEHVLHLIQHWDYQTALHRPGVGRLYILRLVFRAWFAARLARD